MRVITFFYFLVAVTFVLAYVRLQALDLRRARAARRLGAARGTVVVTLVHRVETVTFLGLPLYRYVTVPLAGEVVAALARVDEGRPVDLVVHLPGGVALDVDLIATALRQRPGPVTMIVPACGLSGVGALAEAADALVLGPDAVLDSGDDAGGHRATPARPTDGRAHAADTASAAKTSAAKRREDATAMPAEAWELLALYDQPPHRRGSPLFLPLSRRGRAPGDRRARHP
jgi:hypothetical protein